MLLTEYVYHWRWELQSTPEQIWPWLANTNRFNRDTGLPSLKDERLASSDNPSLPKRHLKFSKFGVPVEWVEMPFEWVKPQRFGVQRLYQRGPVKEMRVIVNITQGRSGGSVIDYSVTAIPRNIVGAAAIPIQIGMLSKHAFAKIIHTYDRLASSHEPVFTYEKKPAFANQAGQRLADIEAELIRATGEPQVVKKLIHFIISADELTLTRIKPYVLADYWHIDRKIALTVFLHATRAGLLNFQWDLICPLCRGAKRTLSHLSDIDTRVHCDACAIDFTVNFERLVELTFMPNPTIVVVPKREFCVGGPFLTPHIMLQQVLPTTERKTVILNLSAGSYRIRAIGVEGFLPVTIAKTGAKNVEIKISTPWEPDSVTIHSTAKLTLVNATGKSVLCLLESTQWSDQAVTAATVIAMQAFRDLFAREALRPHERISVGSQTIVFTDLKGSTSLYRQIGDASAFGHVLAHFEVLKKPLIEENGALIKTIGDAIMAVFPTPVNAVRFVLKSNELLEKATKNTQPLVLKAGIQVGPCIAVSQNEQLDYFGTTVNTAARLVNLSAGHDLIMTEEVKRDPEVRRLLERTPNLQIEPVRAVLKGLEDTEFKIWRIKI